MRKKPSDQEMRAWLNKWAKLLKKLGHRFEEMRPVNMKSPKRKYAYKGYQITCVRCGFNFAVDEIESLYSWHPEGSRRKWSDLECHSVEHIIESAIIEQSKAKRRK